VGLIATRSARGIAGICIGLLLIVWPPACSWLLAVFLLVWGAEQLKEAFLELEFAQNQSDRVALPPGQCPELTGGDPALPGSPLEQPYLGRALPAGGRRPDQDALPQADSTGGSAAGRLPP